MKKRFFKKGFTLAETLTTLAVLGIVAAIGIPMISQRRPNRDILMVKKAYNTIVKVTYDIINDETYYDTDRAAQNGGPILRDLQRAEGTNCQGSTKFCCLFASKVNTIDNPVCGASAESRRFTTSDGITFSIPQIGADNNSKNITIDTNGWDRGINTTIGQTPDRFQFSISPDGRISYSSEFARRYVEAQDVTSRTYNEILQRG